MFVSTVAMATNHDPNSAVETERRRDRRLNTLGRVARLDAMGGGGLCRLHDLSDGGLMIETPLELSVGDPVRIAFDSTNSIQGRVVWQLDNRTGIKFLRPIESTALIRKVMNEGSNGSARAPRMSVNRAATVTSSSETFPTVVGNISQHGMNICHSGNLAAGSDVEVSIEGRLRVRGTVRWSTGMFAGIELVSSVPVEQLASARSF